MFGVHIGQTFYEIVGRNPEIFEFTVDEYIMNPDGSVSFPNKYIGLSAYNEYHLGWVVFTDYTKAEEKTEEIRRIINERSKRKLSQQPAKLKGQNGGDTKQ